MAKTYKAVQGFFCVLLVCVLLFNSFALPRAQALTAEMTLGVAVTALVCLIISSLGVTIQAAQGQDVTDYVGSYFTSWVQQKGYNDVGSWFTAVTGVSVVGWICKVGAGFLAVGKLVYDAVSQFVSYFVAEQGIESGGDPVGSITGGITVSPWQPGGTSSWTWTSSSTGRAVISWSWTTSKQGSVGFDFYGDFPSNTSITISSLPPISTGLRDCSIVKYNSSGGWENQWWFRQNYPSVSRSSISVSSATHLRLSLSNIYRTSSSSPNKFSAGTMDNFILDVTFSEPVYTPSGAVLTPGSDVVGLPSITDDQSYRVIDSDIAVSAGVAGNLANILNKAGTTEGIQTEAAVADTPVNPPDTSPIEGLQDVFPFCLPFDFARFLEIFSAQREAPRVEWVIPLASSGLGIPDQVITIDLSDFDELAATVRNVELIAMCVGLILLTRELLKW